jgi:hypothetical protein
MKIIDTYADILKLFESLNGHFELAAWKEYALLVSKELPEKCIEDCSCYDFEKEVRPVIEAALNGKEKLVKLHDSFLAVTSGLKERWKEVFEADIQADIIFYLGLCNGAGWVTTLSGNPSILLGIEKIIELDWIDNDSLIGLLYHELGHIWHATVGILEYETDSVSEKSLWQLYQEGIAMYCEQLLAGDFSYYHQDKDGWLSWCEENREKLFIEYKRRVDENESTQDFFGDWCNFLGYSDVGYYLGCELIKSISNKYSLKKLANLKIEEIYSELCSLII